MAVPTDGGGGGGGSGGSNANAFIGDRALVAIGLAAGFVLVPRLANAAPAVVNSILLVILLGALLINEERWLPWLKRLATVSARR